MGDELQAMSLEEEVQQQQSEEEFELTEKFKALDSGSGMSHPWLLFFSPSLCLILLLF